MLPPYDPNDPWYATHEWYVLRDQRQVSPDLNNKADVREWWENEGKYRFEEARLRKEQRYKALVRMSPYRAKEFVERLAQARPIAETKTYGSHAAQLPNMLRISYQHEVVVNGAIYKEWDGLDDIIRQIAHWMADKPKPGVLLMGSKGVGKTVMTRAIMDVVHDIDCHYVQYIRAQEFDKVWAYTHKNDDLVAIDDLGREQGIVKDFGNETTPMADYLSYRHAHRLGVIASTNLPPSDVRRVYGDALADRFNEMFMRVTWPEIESYRRTAQ